LRPDGEGCFHIRVKINQKSKLGWSLGLLFEISLNQKDKALLERIQFYFGVGSIVKLGSQAIIFRVESVKDLKVIINHFEKYPLITQKRADYELFKLAYNIIINKEHLTQEGLAKIVSIKALMNKGLSEKLKLVFTNITPVKRPDVGVAKIQDPHWLSGFTTAEGCFMVRVYESYSIYQLIFKLSQHSRDEQLMRSLIQYWDCGNVYKYREAIEFRIHKFSDITDKIIPFFNKYPIHGIKALDYADFVKAADIMKVKGHLTAEGLDQIRRIKAGMNKGR